MPFQHFYAHTHFSLPYHDKRKKKSILKREKDVTSLDNWVPEKRTKDEVLLILAGTSKLAPFNHRITSLGV